LPGILYDTSAYLHYVLYRWSRSSF
jgi:hypothetical protein